MKRLAIICTLLTLGLMPGPVLASCTGWNNPDYFKQATAKDVRQCLNAGANLNARDKDGLTPLHGAATFSQTPAIITTLLNAGADPNTRNKDGLTPLHFAAVFSKTPEVVTVLLDAGANLNARTTSGKTPFDLIPKNSMLRATDVYWRLNESRFR